MTITKESLIAAYDQAIAQAPSMIDHHAEHNYFSPEQFAITLSNVAKGNRYGHGAGHSQGYKTEYTATVSGEGFCYTITNASKEYLTYLKDVMTRSFNKLNTATVKLLPKSKKQADALAMALSYAKECAAEFKRRHEDKYEQVLYEDNCEQALVMCAEIAIYGEFEDNLEDVIALLPRVLHDDFNALLAGNEPSYFAIKRLEQHERDLNGQVKKAHEEDFAQSINDSFEVIEYAEGVKHLVKDSVIHCVMRKITRGKSKGNWTFEKLENQIRISRGMFDGLVIKHKPATSTDYAKAVMPLYSDYELQKMVNDAKKYWVENYTRYYSMPEIEQTEAQALSIIAELSKAPAIAEPSKAPAIAEPSKAPAIAEPSKAPASKKALAYKARDLIIAGHYAIALKCVNALLSQNLTPAQRVAALKMKLAAQTAIIKANQSKAIKSFMSSELNEINAIILPEKQSLIAEIAAKKRTANYLYGSRKGAWGRSTNADRKRSREIDNLERKLSRL